MLHSPRRGEVPERRSRSDRVVLARGRWYVMTREQIDIGPYEVKEAAEFAAAQLSIALNGVDDPSVALAYIAEFQR